MTRAVLLSSMLMVLGCDGRADDDRDSGLDAGPLDASVDAGTVDAGAVDAGSVDAGSVDAGSADAGSVDAGSADAGSVDSGPMDGGTGDAAMGFDGGVRDAGTDAGRDAGPPARADHHIHIYVDNTCGMTVTPMEITVPDGQTAYFDWHNHSPDYEVDVWMSYGGGYTELPMGATWDEPIGHCSTPLAHDEWADISTACSSHRFLIHCL